MYYDHRHRTVPLVEQVQFISSQCMKPVFISEGGHAEEMQPTCSLLRTSNNKEGTDQLVSNLITHFLKFLTYLIKITAVHEM